MDINGVMVPEYGDSGKLKEFVLSVLESFDGNLSDASKALNCSPTTVMRLRDGRQKDSERIRKEWDIPIHPKRVRISADMDDREQANRLHELVKKWGFESWSHFCRTLANEPNWKRFERGQNLVGVTISFLVGVGE